MTRRRSVVPVLCAVACLAGLLHPATGRAGTYYVRACHSDGINAVFTPSYTPGATAFTQCPGGVNGQAGLVARNVYNGTPAAGFTHGEMTVRTPAGTYIDNIQYAGQVVNNSYWQSGLYDEEHARWVWCGPGCGTLPVWSAFNIGGFATRSLQLLTICGSAQCRADGVHGAVMLKDVTLRIQDVWNPGVSIVGGSIASDGWKRGVQTVEVAGSDSAGVRTLRAIAGGRVTDAGFTNCDDHQTVPCPPPRNALSR